MYQCNGGTYLPTSTWHHTAEEQWLVRHIHYSQFRIWQNQPVNAHGLKTHPSVTRHVVGPYWVPGHAGVRGNEITDELARDGSVLEFVGPQLALGVSRQDIWRRIRCWLVNQHWIWWRGLRWNPKTAPELISGPHLGAKARILSFTRTQSRPVTGFLTGDNTLRRHLHLLGLLDSPLCRGVEQRMKPRPTFFVSVKLWPHSDTRIWAPSWSQRTSRV